jgi:hypothetical protein
VAPSIRKELALTSPTSGGHSVGKVRWGHGVQFLSLLFHTQCFADYLCRKPSIGIKYVHSSQTGAGPQRTPYQWVPGFFPRGKPAGAWSSSLISSNAEVTNHGAVSVLALTSSWNLP